MTGLEADLKAAEIRLARDDIGNHHIRLGPEVTKRSDRFSALQQVVATTLGGKLSALVWHLIMFDAIARNSLEDAVGACANVYEHPEGHSIEWQAFKPYRTERRLLSPLTIACLHHSSEFEAMEAHLLDEWRASAPQQLVRWNLYTDPSTALHEMWTDSLCWHLLNLPLPLFAHLSGIQILTALPRRAWARLSTTKIGTDQILLKEVPVLPELFDAVNTSEGVDKDASAMNAVDATMRIKKTLTDAQQRRIWVRSLASKIDLARRCGPVSCLVMGWVLDLSESGTPMKPTAAASTIQQYTRSVMWPLWKFFSSRDDHPSDLTAPDYEEIYRSICSPMKPCARITASKALSSWHRYLVQFFNAPSLRGAISREVEDTPVDAQVIWPHEQDRVAKLLQFNGGDERLINSAKVLFFIAANGPFRADELARLRLANVAIHATAADIEITPSRLHGRLKSDAGQRVVRIVNTQACRIIREWKNRRCVESASQSDLLFGDPVHRGPYRQSAMLALVNQALKQATGDPAASLHGLRHTILSGAADGLLRSSPTGSVNRYGLLGNEAGHASPITTLTSYVHQYEAGLRLHVDCAVRESIKWTSLSAANALGISAATLRQRACRRQSDMRELVWKTLQTRALSQKSLPISFGIDLLDYSPTPLRTVEPKLNVYTTLHILEDRVSGLTVEATAARHQVPCATVEALEDSALTIVREISERRGRKKCGGITLSNALKGLESALQFSGIDLARRWQSKYAPMAEFMAGATATKMVIEAVDAWKTLQAKQHIAMDDLPHAVRLLRLLRFCKVPCTSLRLRIAVPSNLSKLAHAKAAPHMSVWNAIFGEEPVVEICDSRAGRPEAFLIWTSQPEQEVTPSAQGETKGLTAWLFGCAVFARVQAKGELHAQCST
jgi:hypothetical protein